jgi:hypothetical protein
VADQFPVCGGGGSRKACDPGINPPDRIDRIRTICRNPVANEKIVCDGFSHPFLKTMLLFDAPTAVVDFPDLIRGLIRRVAEDSSG